MSGKRPSSGLVVPTLNAGQGFRDFLKSLSVQTLQPDKLLILDSESTDSTVALAREFGFHIHTLSRVTFNHGATRQLGITLCPDAEIVLFMTQDAILTTPHAFESLLNCFDDQQVGAAYGRQVPHRNASPIAAHARHFNYPAESAVRSHADIARLGIKAAFISNSFAAYRRSALLAVGGFPSTTIFGEDTCVAAKMLLDGRKIAYCAEATCYHSHNYTIREEFLRYFDIGVFHSRENWFLSALGRPVGEGKRFVLSEFSYLARTAPRLVPSGMTRTLFKYLGYVLGLREKRLSAAMKRRLSMSPHYWQQQR